jgi:5-methylcytosine-specific restriction enzyme A
MPMSRKLCPAPGCLSTRGKCPRHNADHRQSAAKRGYGQSHKINFRASVLDHDPICVICKQVPAVIADHWPLSRKRLVRLGLNPDNPAYGRGLCWPCHSKATVKNQPGGFNAPR